MKTTTLQLTDSVNRSDVSLLFLLIPLALLAILPTVQATCQQGYPTNDNTVLGDDALVNNTSSGNTAIGARALLNNTSGIQNTVTGLVSLSNTTGTSNTAT